MKPLLLFVTLLFLCSCDLDVTDFDGDQQIDGTTDLQEYAIGDKIKEETSISGAEKDLGVEICGVLEEARNHLIGANGDTYRFKLSERNCTGRLVNERNVSANVISRAGQAPELNGGVHFQDVFTDTHTLLKATCNSLLRGDQTTNTFGDNPRYQIRFRNNNGKWLQIYQFNRSNVVEFIYSARIVTNSNDTRVQGQSAYRQMASGCSNSNNVRQLIQELL